jgi:dihydrofolate reductase
VLVAVRLAVWQDEKALRQFMRTPPHAGLMTSLRPFMGPTKFTTWKITAADGCPSMASARRSYEWLAARWPSRSGELADRLNSLPKYVVSATLANPAWNNSTVLKGDVLNEVWTLKQHIDGDIVIAGSFQLVRTLIEHDLVDELRLKIFPVALGAGERLFGQTTDKKPMRLLDTQTLEGGIAYLTYRSVRDA